MTWRCCSSQSVKTSRIEGMRLAIGIGQQGLPGSPDRPLFTSVYFDSYTGVERMARDPFVPHDLSRDPVLDTARLLLRRNTRNREPAARNVFARSAGGSACADADTVQRWCPHIAGLGRGAGGVGAIRVGGPGVEASAERSRSLSGTALA